ncbi:adenosylmethionine decarboxylase [Shewanella colwelliana]|uniref:adenosylmethionine decarboxylase n=1 Tax=Shewanella colwelliana TaxID=23 RepID=UPI0022B076FB|nr:adenosylmethionine decarboxylase [Shewanella colwelliana]MCZ4336496.1 adenosylmethionine decarboxylase [Shewanella colwelliana]
MFFEGSEKRIEIVVNGDSQSLRSFGDSFWQQAVAKAGADVLSKISNSGCDAYLLSESSLFVWDKRLVMLTCGSTNLVDAALFMIDQLNSVTIAWLSYQRKSEFLSHLQSSHFEDDIQRLNEVMIGRAYRIGHLDGHHHYFYCSQKGESASVSRSMQMYHIDGQVADYLRGDTLDAMSIRQRLKLAPLFGDFEVDDHLFNPFGYSINGIRHNDYFTIHITPQERSSYVSIETNLNSALEASNIFCEMLNILNPRVWDVIGFNGQLVVDAFPPHIDLADCNVSLNQADTLYINHYKQAKRERLVAEAL